MKSVEGHVNRDRGPCCGPRAVCCTPLFYNNASDEYNFSIISNLFDNINSYALYRYTEIENVRKNCIIPVFGEDLKIKGKKLKYRYNLP